MCLGTEGCFHAAGADAAKHAELPIPSDTADRLRERLSRVRGKVGDTPRTIEPIMAMPGPRAVADALFLPAQARDVLRACFIRATFHIEVERPPPERPRPRLVAESIGDRQRRRKTWKQNVDRYALPERARVLVEVAGGPTLRGLLGGPARLRVQEGA